VMGVWKVGVIELRLFGRMVWLMHAEIVTRCKGGDISASPDQPRLGQSGSVVWRRLAGP
jgi:hypothetical protein